MRYSSSWWTGDQMDSHLTSNWNLVHKGHTCFGGVWVKTGQWPKYPQIPWVCVYMIYFHGVNVPYTISAWVGSGASEGDHTYVGVSKKTTITSSDYTILRIFTIANLFFALRAPTPGLYRRNISCEHHCQRGAPIVQYKFCNIVSDFAALFSWFDLEACSLTAC